DGEALAGQLDVDEEAVGGAEDVREQAPVAVAALDVARQADPGASREQRLGAGRGFEGEALHGRSRPHRFGGVDAEQPPALAPASRADVDGVAVDDASDDRLA